MRWFAIAVAAVFILVAAAWGGAYLLPGEYKVTVRRVIPAPLERVHGQVNELARWPEWTVWNKDHDPSLEYEFSGPAAGPGAKMLWKASSGVGSLTIKKSDPQRGVFYEMDFGGGPTPGSVEYQPRDGGAEISWTMRMQMGWNPIGRYFAYFADMPGMIKADFEKGLENLERIASAPADQG